MLKFIRICLVLCFSMVFDIVSSAELGSGAVVKIYNISNSYSYAEPWHEPYQQSSVGSGFIIAGKKILTNAHVAEQSTYLQVQLAGSAQKYEANVLFIDHVCDLALLEVKDPEFLSAVHEVLELGEMPKPRESVVTLGFPIGGEELSYTEGIVSRVEMHQYAQSGAILLAAQIDAPINHGNSGGPVLHNGKVVGVVHQGVEIGQNIGYMIPISVVKHFLADYNSGKYRGFTELGFLCQTMENEALRAKYGLSKEQTGILINKVYAMSDASVKLKAGDVLTKIENLAVANNGTVKIDGDFRVDLTYIPTEAFRGDKIQLTVLRNGLLQDIILELNSILGSNTMVNQLKTYEVTPTYYINGGMVFQPLSVNYLMSQNAMLKAMDAIAVNLLAKANFADKTKDRKEFIVISNVLTSDINVGYENSVNQIVTKVNGKDISDMQDLVQAFAVNTGKVHIITLESNAKIVIKNLNQEENKAILANYKITSDRSDNLKLSS